MPFFVGLVVGFIIGAVAIGPMRRWFWGADGG